MSCDPAAPCFAYRWRLLAVLWVCFFLHQGDRQIFNTLIPLIRSDLGLNDVQIGLIASTFTFAYGLLVPIAGYLGDVGQKRMIVGLSLLTFSTGTLLTGLAGSMTTLILCRSLATGAGESFYYPSASALIGQHHRRTRSLGLAIHQSALYVGIVVSGWLAGWLGQQFGWRVAFLGFGAMGLLWSIVVALNLKNDRADTPMSSTAPAPAPPNLRETLAHILPKPTFYLLAVAFGGQVFVNVGYTTWMATFLHENYGLALASAGFHSMFWHFLAAAAGVMVGARVADQWRARRAAIRLEMKCLGLLLGAPFIAVVAWWPGLNTVFVGLAGFGFFRGLYDSNLFAALFDVVEPRYRATAAGLMLSAAFVTGASAPLALGWIKSVSGLETGLLLLAVVFAAAGLVLLAARQFTFRRDQIVEVIPDSNVA